jgi:hypothetical protein
MSRNSIIRIVPARPPCRGSASDLRYRLLMAALGSKEETNPLLPDATSADEEALEASAASRKAKRPAD